MYPDTDITLELTQLGDAEYLEYQARLEDTRTDPSEGIDALPGLEDVPAPF